MSIQERRVHPKTQSRRPRPQNAGEAKTRLLVRERSGGWCEICGVQRATSVHHRRKRSQGGAWSASNCVAACGDGVRGCHGWVEHNPEAANLVGFHLRPGEDEAATPIVSGFHGRVLLDGHGATIPVSPGARVIRCDGCSCPLVGGDGAPVFSAELVEAAGWSVPDDGTHWCPDCANNDPLEEGES